MLLNIFKLNGLKMNFVTSGHMKLGNQFKKRQNHNSCAKGSHGNEAKSILQIPAERLRKVQMVLVVK